MRAGVIFSCLFIAGCASAGEQQGAADALKKSEPTAPADAAASAETATPGEAIAPVAPADSVAAPAVIPLREPKFDLPRRLPGPASRCVVSGPAQTQIDAVRAKLQKFPTFSGWQALSGLLRQNGQWEAAADALRQEAAQYRAKGLQDAALIRENQAAEIATDVRVFRVRPASEREKDVLYKGAPLEPIVGCYLGAFIDRDDALSEKYFDENWQEHRDSAEFEKLAGKKHASYFMYVKYGQKFPQKWADKLKAHGVIPHIAWEPKSLSEVQDNVYLKSWAASLRKFEWPVFIRFAGEMNGTWTPYHGNPALYRQKFRLIYNALHRASPRVALIWCVNSVPLGNIDSYYPGDDAVDWVGINVYSVPFFDNDPSRPAFNASPLTLIDPIYRKYSARKPIAICEFAASFLSRADGKTRIALAQDKMAQLYSALPLLYPRIKLIDWFSMDTVRHARPGRQLNNYRLTEHEELLGFYRALTADEYYMSGPEHLADARPALGFALARNERFQGSARLALWVKTYVMRPKVYARLNGKIIYAQARPGAHTVNIDLKGLRGAQSLELLVYDDRNNFITSRAVPFTVA